MMPLLRMTMPLMETRLSMSAGLRSLQFRGRHREIGKDSVRLGQSGETEAQQHRTEKILYNIDASKTTPTKPRRFYSPHAALLVGPQVVQAGADEVGGWALRVSL